MGYFTIKKESRAEYEEKKSVFIGRVKRVYSDEEARDFISKVKTMEKEARHNVYAYVLGENMGIQRYSDDGEPQGTGGIPVLEVIKKSGITDTVVVVTRYFGGVLLGTGGLVRAYSKSASMAVKEGEIVEKVKGTSLSIDVDYDLFGKVQYLCGQNSWFIEEIKYTDKVSLILLCEIKEVNNIGKMITEVTNGKAIISYDIEAVYFKSEGRLYLELN